MGAKPWLKWTFMALCGAVTCGCQGPQRNDGPFGAAPSANPAIARQGNQAPAPSFPGSAQPGQGFATGPGAAPGTPGVQTTGFANNPVTPPRPPQGSPPTPTFPSANLSSSTGQPSQQQARPIDPFATSGAPAAPSTPAPTFGAQQTTTNNVRFNDNQGGAPLPPPPTGLIR